MSVSLRQLIAYAYDLRPDYIRNAPVWADSDRYDVNAVMPNRVRSGDRAMLQLLLEDRFALRVVRQTQELPVYALLRVKPDRLGPQLRSVTVNGGDRSKCRMGIRPGLIDAKCTDWKALDLSRQLALDRIVIDKTQLQGHFDVRLEWTPDLLADGSRDRTTAPEAKLEPQVSVFTALQEQLGLKIESQRGPVEVLVIDHVEPPTPD